MSLLEVSLRGRARGMPVVLTTDGLTNHVLLPPRLTNFSLGLHWTLLCRPNRGVADPSYWLERFGVAQRTCLECQKMVAAVLAAARSPARTRSGK